MAMSFYCFYVRYQGSSLTCYLLTVPQTQIWKSSLDLIKGQSTIPYWMRTLGQWRGCTEVIPWWFNSIEISATWTSKWNDTSISQCKILNNIIIDIKKEKNHYGPCGDHRIKMLMRLSNFAEKFDEYGNAEIYRVAEESNELQMDQILSKIDKNK